MDGDNFAIVAKYVFAEHNESSRGGYFNTVKARRGV